MTSRASQNLGSVLFRLLLWKAEEQNSIPQKVILFSRRSVAAPFSNIVLRFAALFLGPPADRIIMFLTFYLNSSGPRNTFKRSDITLGFSLMPDGLREDGPCPPKSGFQRIITRRGDFVTSPRTKLIFYVRKVEIIVRNVFKYVEIGGTTGSSGSGLGLS